MVVEVTNNKGKKSNVVAFNGQKANGKIFNDITKSGFIKIYIYVRTSSIDPLFMGTVSRILKFQL